MLHIDAQIRLDPALQQRSGTRATELVGDYRCHEHVSLETGAGANDGLDGADGRNAATLIVVGAHPPDPAVLVLAAVGVDGPSAHLDPGVHMTVDEKCRATATTFESADRLAALLLWVERMRDLLHVHIEPDVGHVVSVEVGDFA